MLRGNWRDSERIETAALPKNLFIWQQLHWFTVVSIQSRFDTSRFDTNWSKFVTHVKSIRYKLTLLQIVSIQNSILERTQTSVVNKANPYLREPPHVSKPPTQWEHVNETKFWFGLFIENRDLHKWFWNFFYNSSAYYTYDQETQILSIMSCKLVKQRTREEIAVILARG